MQKTFLKYLALILTFSSMFMANNVLSDELPPDISHAVKTPIKQGETITAVVIDEEDGVKSVILYFLAAGKIDAEEISMTAIGDTVMYSAEIPSGTTLGAGRYLIKAVDNRNNFRDFPENADFNNVHTWQPVTVTDGIPPVISHTRLSSVKQGETISSEVTDLTEVASVTLSVWDVEEHKYSSITMKGSVGADTYSASIPLEAMLGKGYYFIEAKDTANNVSTLPANASSNNKHTWYDVRITDGIPPTITHTPLDSQQPGLEIPATVVEDNVDQSPDVKFYFWQDTKEEMEVNVAGNKYVVLIPSHATQGDAYYLIVAVDHATEGANTSYKPDGAVFDQKNTWQKINILPDTTNPVISHEKPQSLEIGSILVATVTDNVSVSSVMLFFSDKAGGPFDTLEMSPSTGNKYASNTPTQIPPGKGFYHIEARDTAGNKTETQQYQVNTTDTTSPVIAHAAIPNAVENQPVEIVATVTDNYAVGKVVLSYWGEGIATTELQMEKSEPPQVDQYVASIPGMTVGGDSLTLFYAITATDSPANEKIWPESGEPGKIGSKIIITRDFVAPEIEHTPVASIEAGVDKLIISSTITDNVTVKEAILKFTDAEGISDEMSMTLSDTPNVYQAEIPVQVRTGVVSYYIKAFDTAGNSTPDEPGKYKVDVVDTTAPELEHTPVVSAEAGSQIPITIEATDNTQISSVILFYRTIDAEDFVDVAMAGTGPKYSANIPAQETVGEVKYYIEVKDITEPANVSSTASKTVPHVINVVDTTPPSLTHSPLESAQPYDVIAASATDIVGVTTVTFYYRAPGSSTFSPIPVELIAPDQYEAHIPKTTPAGKAHYYIEALDEKDNASTYPPEHATDETELAEITILPDDKPPVILHEKMDRINVGGVVTAKVYDNVGISEVFLLFGYQRETGFRPVEMAPTIDPTVFEGTIPLKSQLGHAYYYIKASDTKTPNPNISYYPAGAETAPDVRWETEIIDEIKPSISHEQVKNGVQHKEIEILATVTDNTEIAKVILHYRNTTDGLDADRRKEMTHIMDDIYSADIPSQEIPAGETIGRAYYYIEAVDIRDNVNYAPYALEAWAEIFISSDLQAPLVIHTPVSSVKAGEEIPISVVVTDDVQVNSKSVKLTYTDVANNSFTLVMALDENTPDKYITTIPAQRPIGTVSYYIEAEDIVANKTRIPADKEYEIDIYDDVPPEISHEPVEEASLSSLIKISAQISDNGEIATVMLYYKGVDAEEFVDVQMTLSDDQYVADIPAQTITGTIFYYIVASDSAPTGEPVNVTYVPADYTANPYQISILDTSAPIIVHEPVAEIQPGFELIAFVTDEVVVTQVTLYLSLVAPVSVPTDFVPYDMTFDEPDRYSAIIPKDAKSGPMKYYIEAKDNAALEPNVSYSPTDAPDNTHSATVFPDKTAPQITHTALTNAEAGFPIPITAIITDNVGVEKIFLFYQEVGSEAITALSMKNPTENPDEFSANIPPQTATGKLLYYITATDARNNSARLPETEPMSFKLNVEDTTPPTIEHDLLSFSLLTEEIPVIATITDNISTKVAALYYQGVGETKYTSVQMITADDINYSATIPAQSEQGKTYYYLRAEDTLGNTTYLPDYAEFGAGAPIDVKADTESPVILHTPLSSFEPGVFISAIITDNSSLSSVVLYYKDRTDFVQLQMLPTENENEYSATIPATIVPGEGSYYIEAVDKSGNASSSGSATEPHEVEIKTDSTPPSITHEAVDNMPAGAPQPIFATVTDFVGVVEVTLYFEEIEGLELFKAVEMTSTGTPGEYLAVIPPVSSARKLDYYIVTSDVADNVSRSPETTDAYHTINVLPDEKPPTIIHTPLPAAQAGDVIVATVTDNVEVTKVEVHYLDVGATAFTFLEGIASEVDPDVYSVAIPSDVKVGSARYYIKAEDANGNGAYHPAKNVSHSIQIQPDTIKPIIIYEPTADAEAGEPTQILTTVTDNVTVKSVDLIYTGPDGPGALTMIPTENPDEYATEVPGQHQLGEMSYYIKAEDMTPNTAYLPENAPEEQLSISIVDTKGPEIQHDEIPNALAGEPISIAADVTDKVQVKSVVLQYQGIGEEVYETLPMEPTGRDNEYLAEIPAQQVPADKLSAKIYYIIVAEDGQNNFSFEPPSGEELVGYQIIVSKDIEPPVIQHDKVVNVEPGSIIRATVTDNAAIQSVGFFFRSTTSTTFTKLDMLPTEVKNEYAVVIPDGIATGQAAYYIEAVDEDENKTAFPETWLTDNVPAAFEIKADTTPPEIVHNPVKLATAGEEINVHAMVTDFVGVSFVTLFYKGVEATAFISVEMSRKADEYSATIPPQNDAGNLYYYIRARDAEVNTVFHPATAPNTPHTIEVASDKIAPAIIHNPVAAAQPGDIITAVATDNVGVASVSFFYTSPGASTYTEMAMSESESGAPGSYEVTIPAQAGVGAARYYIKALDIVGNPGFHPGEGQFHAISITPDSKQPIIVHEPVSQAEAGEEIPVSVTVTDNVQVKTVLLLYKGLGEDTLFTLQLTAQGELFSANIPGQQGTGQLSYHIEAQDTASPPNIARHPTDAPATHQVNIVDTKGPDIAHTQVPSAREKEPIVISVRLIDPVGIPPAEAFLYYQGVGEAGFTKVPLVLKALDEYTATIPAQPQMGQVRYNLEAQDNKGNRASSPAFGVPYSINITDGTPPEIVHTPIPSAQEKKDIPIKVTVTDNVEVTSVVVFHKGPGKTNFSEATLEAISNTDNWEGLIPAASTIGELLYYIQASDANQNNITEPEDTKNPFTINVTDTTPPAISHTRVLTKEVGQTIRIDAIATDNLTVKSVILYYRDKADKNFTELEMTTITPGNLDLFSADIPAFEDISTVYYYITAMDDAGSLTFEPPSAEQNKDTAWAIEITDSTPPDITYDIPVTFANAGKPITINLRVLDKGKIESVTLYYKGTEAEPLAPYETIAFKAVGTAGDFTVDIPAQPVSGTVVYFIEAKDKGDNAVYRNRVEVTEDKSQAMNNPYQLSIEDKTGPDITHEGTLDNAEEYYTVSAGKQTAIIARVKDVSGVQDEKIEGAKWGVSLYWYAGKSKDGKYRTIRMQKTIETDTTRPEDEYAALLPQRVGNIYYYFEATDKLANTSTLPERPIGADLESRPENVFVIQIEAPEELDIKIANNLFNPDNGEKCTILLALPTPAKNVSINIYNLAGYKIQNLSSGSRLPGSYSIDWTGRNQDSDYVASGIYFVVIIIDDKRDVRRIAVVR